MFKNDPAGKKVLGGDETMALMFISENPETVQTACDVIARLRQVATLTLDEVVPKDKLHLFLDSKMSVKVALFLAERDGNKEQEDVLKDAIVRIFRH